MTGPTQTQPATPARAFGRVLMAVLIAVAIVAGAVTTLWSVLT